MSLNILILCGPEGAATYAAELAARSGSDIGLVNTGLPPDEVPTMGCRIEDERTYGGRTLSAFDEPLSVGSAVAQLAGHADAVVVDRLDDWSQRLANHFGEDRRSIVSEVTSVCSVLKAQLLDMVMLAARPDQATGVAADLTREIMGQVEPLCDVVVDLTDGEPKLLRGQLPD